MALPVIALRISTTLSPKKVWRAMTRPRGLLSSLLWASWLSVRTARAWRRNARAARRPASTVRMALR